MCLVSRVKHEAFEIYIFDILLVKQNSERKISFYDLTLGLIILLLCMIFKFFQNLFWAREWNIWSLFECLSGTKEIYVTMLPPVFPTRNWLVDISVYEWWTYFIPWLMIDATASLVFLTFFKISMCYIFVCLIKLVMEIRLILLKIVTCVRMLLQCSPLIKSPIQHFLLHNFSGYILRLYVVTFQGWSYKRRALYFGHGQFSSSFVLSWPKFWAFKIAQNVAQKWPIKVVVNVQWKNFSFC